VGGGIVVNETIYTYSYRNRGLSSNGDVTSPKSYQVGPGFGVAATDIAGRLSTTSYRTVGDILQFEREDTIGALRAGVWFEHSHLSAHRDATDLTSGTLYNANANVAAASPVLFDYRATLDTIAPYADFDWKASPSLDIRTGLRYQHVRRGFDASVVPNSRPGTPGEVTRSFGSVLPSVEGNYALDTTTHVYAQWGKGSLVPSQAFFYTNDPALGNQAQPQTSQALQGGVVYAGDRVNLTVDAYEIDFSNYVSQVTDAEKNTLFVNNGNVRYRGLEGEGNVALGLGFAAVLNGSLIRAQFRNDAMATPTQRAGDTIPFAPTHTGLLGLLYRRGLWSGSLLTKFVGAEYQGPGGSADGPDRRVGSYHYSNLSLTRALDDFVAHRRASAGLEINNLENRSPVTDSAGRAAIGAARPLLVNVLPKRSFTLFLRGQF
jgi:iron complex outermembrane receptor protein